MGHAGDGKNMFRADSLTFTWLPPENDSPGRYQITAAGKKPVWITEPSFILTGLSREDVGKITVLAALRPGPGRAAYRPRSRARGGRGRARPGRGRRGTGMTEIVVAAKRPP